ncbi:GntR family transcriptional regulator [Sphaerotilus sp.]|jgi:DNA-binding GntR family transcriptional regulator|uniref:GntR family transcriptional regulator n=1 Tax=Sphaerotilus sp. TaxID=2093942 RepID=UPI00286E1562|nr:GntR family transcriptional regulator [Sphaerotilus sp.]
MKISERLCETIEELIATGELAPGSALDEAMLVERYAVSRTPVREALIQLAAEGLVELRPRRGAVVAQATPQRLVEMFEVMAELEAMCARLAARRLNDADLAALDAALACCEAAAAQHDPDAYFYANEEFHRALYTASHNDFLFGQTLALQRKLRPYRRLQLRVRHRMQHSLTEHAEILAALRQGDAALAMEATRRHVVVQGERFADLLASLQLLTAA